MTKATPIALTGWRGPLKSISQPNPLGLKCNENIQKKKCQSHKNVMDLLILDNILQ